MGYAKLKEEHDTDPLGRGYADMTPQQVADDMNTAYRSKVSPLVATSRTLMARLDPADAAAILDAFDEDTDRIVQWTMRHVTGDGVDLGNDNTRAQIQELANRGTLTQEQADALLDLAVVSMTRAEELRVLGRSPKVGDGHIERVRA